jgi:hypothetical protein
MVSVVATCLLETTAPRDLENYQEVVVVLL